MSDGIKIFSLETISGDSLLNAYLDVFTRFYPDFDEWFMRKVVPNLGVTREIFLAKIGKDIAGICIISDYQECSKHWTSGISSTGRRWRTVDDTSVTKSFVFTGDGKPSPDLSDFKPFGHIDEDKPKYSAIMIIEDEGVYIPVIYKECRVDLDVDNPTIRPLSGPCMECCCYSTPELAIKAGTRIYRNMLKDNR